MNYINHVHTSLRECTIGEIRMKKQTLWAVYESNKQHGDRHREVKTTSALIWWILFGKPNYIVTINKRKDK